MNMFKRCHFLKAGVCGMATMSPPDAAVGQTYSLSGLSASVLPLPRVTVYKARQVLTLDPAKPGVDAVAVVDGRILLACSLEDVVDAIKGQHHTVDTRFADKVIVPGFVAQAFVKARARWH